MKKTTGILTFFLVLVLVFGYSSPSLAKKQVYAIDLVRFDLEDIEEPSGQGKIIVDFPKKADPYIQQVLNDQITPLIVTANDTIKKIARRLQSEIDAFQEDPTNGKKKKKVQKGILKLNNDYDKIIASTEKAAKNNLKSEWKRIKKENKALRKHKIKVVFKIGKQAFSISTAVARLVVTSGGDVTGYIQIAKSVKKLYRLTKTELEDLRAKQRKAMKAIEKLKTAMNTNKGSYSSKKAKFKKYYTSFIKKPRKKLKTATSALQVKMIASRRNIQSLASTLDSLVVATATLPEGDKKGEAQKKVDSLIKGIIDKHEVIEANKVLVTFAKNLLDDAKRATSKPAKIVKSIGNNAKKTKRIAKGIKNAIKYSEEGIGVMQDIIDLFV